MWVPRRVKDLLAEVKAVDTDLILTPLPTYTHLEDDNENAEALRCGSVAARIFH